MTAPATATVPSAAERLHAVAAELDAIAVGELGPELVDAYGEVIDALDRMERRLRDERKAPSLAVYVPVVATPKPIPRQDPALIVNVPKYANGRKG